MDTTREIRAMALAAFPCPPLPMVGLNGNGQEAEMNSHDLLAMLMNTAALRGDAKEDQARELLQFKLTQAYMATLHHTKDPLQAMRAFTRDYMATYGPARDVRYRERASARLEEQQKAWLRAQFILRDMEVEEVFDWLKQARDLLISSEIH